MVFWQLQLRLKTLIGLCDAMRRWWMLPSSQTSWRTMVKVDALIMNGCFTFNEVTNTRTWWHDLWVDMLLFSLTAGHKQIIAGLQGTPTLSMLLQKSLNMDQLWNGWMSWKKHIILPMFSPTPVPSRWDVETSVLKQSLWIVGFFELRHASGPQLGMKPWVYFNACRNKVSGCSVCL